jgi:hypothetical protein
MPTLSRRTALVGLLVGGCLTVTRLPAQEPSLHDTLKNGLKARRPIEFQFVGRVADLTEQGALPRAYVLATFDYARKRRPKFPMPYFEFIIRKKADELGVDIGVPSTLEN